MNEPARTSLRALVVEDSEDDALLLVEHLRRGHFDTHWKRVHSRADLQHALEQEEWDIVFGDYTIPGFGGAEALAIVRERRPLVPFIFVSGTIGEETAVEAIRAGAQDYIIKDRMARLIPAVERELRDAASSRERERTHRELRLLQSVTESSSETRDEHSVLSNALARIGEATSCRLALTWVPDDDGSRLVCSRTWCSGDREYEGFHALSEDTPLAPGQCLPGRVLQARETQWVDDVTCMAGFSRASGVEAAGLGAALGVPVVTRDGVLAVLEFFFGAARGPDRRLMELVDAVAAQLGNVIQRKRAEEQLHYLAHHDALTGLPNRVLFSYRLELAIRDAHRSGSKLAVGLLDLDRFKTVNDSLGHGVGDLLLQAVAERLKGAVRSSDTLARFSGDEFTLLLTGIDRPEDVGLVASEMLGGLSRPFPVAGHELYAGGSLGIAVFPDDGADTDELLRNADIAMYRAKRHGGNSYDYYTGEMTTRAHARLELETALRGGLDREEFVLHYQPVVELESRRVTGVEALVRWNHPEHGLLGPDTFIPVAEEIGLISRLGAWVLDTACREVQTFPSPPAGDALQIAVNVSPQQFLDPQFKDTVFDSLQRSGLDPRRLDLEITENLLMENDSSSPDTMRELGERGVQFSVDDFGTGYSSLGYLKTLPIARLKIDRSFIACIPDNANDVAITVAIISMAGSLGLKVVAEGVETEEQAQFLVRQGCRSAQGYHFSKPLPVDALRALLIHGSPFPTP